MDAVVWLIDSVLGICFWIIVAHVVASWLAAFNAVNARQPFVHQAGPHLTEPVLGPIRELLGNLFGNLGGIDMSPVVAPLLVGFLRRLLAEVAADFLRAGSGEPTAGLSVRDMAHEAPPSRPVRAQRGETARGREIPARRQRARTDAPDLGPGRRRRLAFRPLPPDRAPRTGRLNWRRPSGSGATNSPCEAAPDLVKIRGLQSVQLNSRRRTCLPKARPGRERTAPF